MPAAWQGDALPGPTALSTSAACMGDIQLANAPQKAKQKAQLGERVRGGSSCSSKVWYSRSLVGAVKWQGTGELCSASWVREKRIIQKQSKQDRLKSQQERGMETGSREELPKHSSCWSIPPDRLRFFRLTNWRAALQEPLVFLPSLLIPLSAAMCTFENDVSLESLYSGISGTCVLMCQWKPSTWVCSNWSDFRNALGKHRLEKVTERTGSQALIETLLFSECNERLLPPVWISTPSSPSPASLFANA